MSFYPLLVTRFLFGAGEAGAFPNASIVVARWFPSHRGAMLCGTMLAAAQIGGAASPLLVVPIQVHFGWRMSFFVFGAIGIVWAGAWYVWYRDTPPGSPERPQARSHHSFPWHAALHSPSTLALLVTAACYVYVFNFFQTWFHTFLVRGRGFGEGSLWLSAFPYVVAACANLAGGAASDWLVQKLGRKNGRRSVGATALGIAGIFTLAAMLTRGPILTMLYLAVVYGAITFQQSGVFGVCLDIGRARTGAMVGLMNTAGQIGGFVGSVAYGHLVEYFGNYDAPFLPMAALLFLGALLWLKVDASKELMAHHRS